MPYKDPEKRREARRRYEQNNPEKVAASRKKKWKTYADKNRELLNAKARERYAAQKDRRRAARRAYYVAHADAQRAYSRNYHAAHKDRQNANSRAYHQQHRPTITARLRLYARAHQAEKTLRDRLWRQKNPEEVRARKLYRRALHLQAPRNDFTAAQWREMQTAYDHCCAYCGRRAKGHLTQDHIMPLSKGGSHTASNIVPACNSCNSRKHDGPPLVPVQPLLLTVAPPRKKKGSGE